MRNSQRSFLTRVRQNVWIIPGLLVSQVGEIPVAAEREAQACTSNEEVVVIVVASIWREHARAHVVVIAANAKALVIVSSVKGQIIDGVYECAIESHIMIALQGD